MFTRPKVTVVLIIAVFICSFAIENSSFAGKQPIPFENGIDVEHFSSGMFAPTEMAFDHLGNLFVASGYEPSWPIGGHPTPIFKVFPNGTTVPFSIPVSDPDALSVSSVGDVYVGSYGGIITKIDGITENQTLFLKDNRLKNIDGLRFSPSGLLYTVAIDSAKVHTIDIVTKTVTEIADLSLLNITGMSGIAFHPVTNEVYVESPLENKIIKLDLIGPQNHSVIASGFSFLGFIDFDPTGNNNDYIFGPDALDEKIYKININTGLKTVYIDQIIPGPVGLVFDPNGVLYFNVNYDQVPDGEVYRAWGIKTVLSSQNPVIGDPISVLFQSKFGEMMPYGAFLSLNDNGPTLPDGRQFPLSVTPFFLLSQALLDGNGEAGLSFTIPNDTSYIGLTVYFAFATYKTSPFSFLGISKAASMTIH